MTTIVFMMTPTKRSLFRLRSFIDHT